MKITSPARAHADLIIVSGDNHHVEAHALSTHASSQATAAQVEAEDNIDAYVPPDLLNSHPGVAKVWCLINAAGGLESPSRNVASVTDVGTGDRTIVIATDFSSTVYVTVNGMQNRDAAVGHDYESHAVGSVKHFTFNGTTVTDYWSHTVMFGDQ